MSRCADLAERVVESARDAPEPVAEVTIEVLISAKQYGAESLAAAALARLIRAILNALSHNEKGLLNVVSAPSDLQALLTFLEEPAVIEELAKHDPLAPARARGILRKAELYQAEGGCVSAEDAGKLVRVTRQSIDKARQRGDVLAFPRGRDGWTYPIWQFANGRYLHGLPEVLSLLQSHGPFVQASFLLSSHALLDGKAPLTLLKADQLEPVIKAAQAFAEHGAS